MQKHGRDVRRTIEEQPTIECAGLMIKAHSKQRSSRMLRSSETSPDIGLLDRKKKPGQWLHNAIRKNKQLRKKAIQDLISSQQHAGSPNDLISSIAAPQFCVGGEATSHLASGKSSNGPLSSRVTNTNQNQKGVTTSRNCKLAQT